LASSSGLGGFGLVDGIVQTSVLGPSTAGAVKMVITTGVLIVLARTTWSWSYAPAVPVGDWSGRDVDFAVVVFE
jgi:hypothetical protein